MASRGLERAAEALARARSLLVVTGAGVSAESGIPTFRGAGGLWEGFRAEELATPQAFARDARQVWRWYRWRRTVCLGASPNPAHRVIAALEEDFDPFLLATQNVDGLHRRAGSRRILELHGNIHFGRCTGCGLTGPLEDDPSEEIEDLPSCRSCGALLRPHVVWFGETYHEGVLETAAAAGAAADAALVAGTSAQVWPPVAIALQAQRSGAVLIDVNPDRTSLSVQADVHLQGAAGEILPELHQAVRKLREGEA
jgi:NAD-dependent deacetylase